MSIYATGSAKSYRAKVVLSDGKELTQVYDLYAQHPAGRYDFGPKNGDNRLELIEIEGVSRDGEPSSVIVPEWVLRHFLAVIDNGELNYDATVDFLGEDSAKAELRELIRLRRGKV